MDVVLSHKLWTRTECDALIASGMENYERLELIEGQLIDKKRKTWSHVMCAAFLRDWLYGLFGSRKVIQYSPIDVAPEDNPSSEPEPHLIVLKQDILHFKERHPGPQDLHLVIEVPYSDLRFDLTTKAGLYARAGIVDYWVLDIPGRRMIVHRDPQAGRYASVAAYTGEESVAPLAAPESFLRIRDAFEE